MLDELRSRARHAYVSKTRLAQICLALGQIEEALELLDLACDERATDLIWLTSDPAFDAVRAHPRFSQLVARLGLVACARKPTGPFERIDPFGALPVRRPDVMSEDSMSVPAERWEKIEHQIASESSPVGIDAKKTHIVIIHMLERLEGRLDELSDRVARLER